MASEIKTLTRQLRMVEKVISKAREQIMIALLRDVQGVLDMTDPEHENYNDSQGDIVHALCELEPRIKAAIRTGTTVRRQAYTLAEVRDGTGFPKGARFTLVEE